MTSGLALLARWSVRQKLNRVSVQLRRSERALRQHWFCIAAAEAASATQNRGFEVAAYSRQFRAADAYFAV